MTDLNMVFAGFGGQGILFIGKLVANAALIDGKNVTWLPSYGPEMRGGTANCGVCISKNEIGSPIISDLNAFIAMSKPSFNKFLGTLNSDGVVVVDSSIVDLAETEKGKNIFEIPATKLAQENGIPAFANMIVLGKLLKEVPFTSFDTIVESLRLTIPEKLKHLVESNIEAIKLGMAQTN